MKKILSTLAIVLAMNVTTSHAQSLPDNQEKIEVTNAEMTEFAEVFQKIRMVNQEAQQQMIKVVEEQDLDAERFNEIHQATMDPNKEVQATEDESKKYNVIVAELEEMQPKFKDRMEQLIEESTLSPQRYQEMVMALQTNPDLQKRFQKILQG